MQLALPVLPSRPVPSIARSWVDSAAWLLAPGSVVQRMDVVDATTINLLVADPLVVDPHDRIEADHLAADSARTVLEQAAHGVRLLPITRDGYVGRINDLAPAQLTFLTGLPGVQRYDLLPSTPGGDGAPSTDVVHHIEVDTAADAARLDWLLRDRFDEGSLQHGAVTFGVPEQPWTLAPVPGAR